MNKTQRAILQTSVTWTDEQAAINSYALTGNPHPYLWSSPDVSKMERFGFGGRQAEYSEVYGYYSKQWPFLHSEMLKPSELREGKSTIFLKSPPWFIKWLCPNSHMSKPSVDNSTNTEIKKNRRKNIQGYSFHLLNILLPIFLINRCAH